MEKHRGQALHEKVADTRRDLQNSFELLSNKHLLSSINGFAFSGTVHTCKESAKCAAVAQSAPPRPWLQVQRVASLPKENLRLEGRGGHDALHSQACSRHRLRARGSLSSKPPLADSAPTRDGSLERSPAPSSEDSQTPVRPPSPLGPRAAGLPEPARGCARASLAPRLKGSRDALWASRPLDLQR